MGALLHGEPPIAVATAAEATRVVTARNIETMGKGLFTAGSIDAYRREYETLTWVTGQPFDGNTG
jgi:hypothetical protein